MKLQNLPKDVTQEQTAYQLRSCIALDAMTVSEALRLLASSQPEATRSAPIRELPKCGYFLVLEFRWVARRFGTGDLEISGLIVLHVVRETAARLP